jgi:trans-aconitate methyltransferase
MKYNITGAQKTGPQLEQVGLISPRARISEKLDVIFSNATPHWIWDHEQAFCHFWNLLKSRPERAQLLIQCRG